MKQRVHVELAFVQKRCSKTSCKSSTCTIFGRLHNNTVAAATAVVEAAVAEVGRITVGKQRKKNVCGHDYGFNGGSSRRNVVFAVILFKHQPFT